MPQQPPLPQLGGRNQEPTSRSTMIVGLYGALAVAAFGIGALRGDPDIYRIAGKATAWKMVLSPIVGIAVGLAIVFITRLAVHRLTWARRLHHSFRGLLGDLSTRDIFILAVASSIGEELLFRGALMPWIGVWWSTAIFALLHIGPGVRFLTWTASAFVVGLLFAGLHYWLGDLGAPILAHFTVNFMNLGYIVRTDLPSD